MINFFFTFFYKYQDKRKRIKLCKKFERLFISRNFHFLSRAGVAMMPTPTPWFRPCLYSRINSLIHKQLRFVTVDQVTTSYMKMISSYVMQDDQLFPMLTVFETFMFAAEVRLPHSISKAEKKIRVHELLHQLGLEVIVKSPSSRVGRIVHENLNIRNNCWILCRVQCTLILVMREGEEYPEEKGAEFPLELT